MHMFGFSSLKHFAKIALGLQHKNIVLLDAAVALTLTCFTMVQFVEEWIWSPAFTLIFYMVVLVADFFSGMAVGVQVKKEGFITQKAQRILIILPTHLLLLGFFYNIGKVNTALGIESIGEDVFEYPARAFYFFVIGINAFSFVKNMVLLGAIKGAIADFFEKYVDIHKNMRND